MFGSLFVLVQMGKAKGRILREAPVERGRYESKEERKLFEAKLIPIAHVASDTNVAVRGVVHGEHDALVVAPLSQKPAVWVRLRVMAISGVKNARVTELLAFEVRRPFHIEDSDGQRAQIDPTDGLFLAENGHRALGKLPDIEARIESFVRQFADAPPDLKELGGASGMLEYTEEALIPGDTVTVLGSRKRDERGAGYRGSGVVTLTAEDGGLLVTTRSIDDIAARVGRRAAGV